MPSIRCSFVTPALFGLTMLVPSLTFAQSTCETDGDCAKGFVCEVVGGSSCGSPGCPPGEECPPPPPCENEVFYGCVPGPCTADADCAAGSVCHEWVEECAQSDCACSSDMPECKCEPAPRCDPMTVSMCTPKYALDCEVDADCGEGFRCDRKVCQVQEIPCSDASDCQTGWACVGEAAGKPGCAGEGCPEPAEPLEPPAAEQFCQPPYYGGVSTGGDYPASPEGAPTSGGVPKGNQGNGAEDAGDDTDGERTSEGCQIGGAAAGGSAGGWMLAFMLLLGLRRLRA